MTETVMLIANLLLGIAILLLAGAAQKLHEFAVHACLQMRDEVNQLRLAVHDMGKSQRIAEMCVEESVELTPAPHPAVVMGFGAWMRECAEQAHREFMVRTANLPRCDGRESLAEKLKRYFGDRQY